MRHVVSEFWTAAVSEAGPHWQAKSSVAHPEVVTASL